jgi:hypothetical protein
MGKGMNDAQTLNRNQMNKPLPTIEELERILSSPEEKEIEILPDGSIHAVPKGTKQDAEVKVITSKYAAAEFY